MPLLGKERRSVIARVIEGWSLLFKPTNFEHGGTIFRTVSIRDLSMTKPSLLQKNEIM